MTPPDAVPEDDEELRQLADLCRRLAPDDPGEAAWAGMSARIANSLPPRPRRWPWWIAASVAAALFALLLVNPRRSLNDDAPELEDEDPYPVALASEVHILSVDAKDADRLAVGQPFMGVFEVASASEVQIEKADPDPESGIWPHVAASGLAMIIAGENEP